MSALRTVLELHDLDQLLELVRDDERAAKLRRLGYGLEGVAGLQRERERMIATLDRRWAVLYERSHGRYGRGITTVRDRVCQGCFVTLPTSASPPPGEAQLHLCESCGRLLYWR